MRFILSIRSIDRSPPTTHTPESTKSRGNIIISVFEPKLINMLETHYGSFTLYHMFMCQVMSNGSRSHSACLVRLAQPFGCFTTWTRGSIFSSISVMLVWSWGCRYRVPADNSIPLLCVSLCPSTTNRSWNDQVQLQTHWREQPSLENRHSRTQKQRSALADAHTCAQ